jgi:hypothetical protein
VKKHPLYRSEIVGFGAQYNAKPGRWLESEKPRCLKVIHHRQNPIVTTSSLPAMELRQFVDAAVVFIHPGV